MLRLANGWIIFTCLCKLNVNWKSNFMNYRLMFTRILREERKHSLAIVCLWAEQRIKFLHSSEGCMLKFFASIDNKNAFHLFYIQCLLFNLILLVSFWIWWHGGSSLHMCTAMISDFSSFVYKWRSAKEIFSISTRRGHRIEWNHIRELVGRGSCKRAFFATSPFDTRN